MRDRHSPGGVRDPEISIRMIRIRREVLVALRLLGRGRLLEAADLGRVVRATLVGPEFEGNLEPADSEISNCGRHFGRARRRDEDDSEEVLSWRNAGGGKTVAFWLAPERDLEDVDAVLAEYDRRLVAHALSKAIPTECPRCGKPTLYLERDGLCESCNRYDLVGRGSDSEDVPTREPPEDRGWASAPSARTEIERLEEERMRKGEVSIPPVDREFEPVFPETGGIGERSNAENVPDARKDRAFSIRRVERIVARVLSDPSMERYYVIGELAAIASREWYPTSAIAFDCIDEKLATEFLGSKLSERASILFRVADAAAEVARESAKYAYGLARELHDE